MGLFGRSKKKLPRWARPLGSLDRFERFVGVVLETFADRDPPVEEWQVRSGSILLSDTVEMALDDAVDQCAEREPDAWPAVLRELATESALSAGDLGEAVDVEVGDDYVVIGDRRIDLVDGDFEDIAPFLRLQLFSAGEIDRDDTISRDVGPGLFAAVVFDFGDIEQSVEASRTGAWERDEDAIWKVALENLAADSIAGQKLETAAGDVLLIAGEGDYVASLVLRWRDVLARDEPPGAALIALPSRHALLVHIIDDGDAETGRDMVDVIKELADQMAGELDDWLSVDVYFEPAAGEPLRPASDWSSSNDEEE